MTSGTMTEIDVIEKHAENIRNGLDEKVKPGMEGSFTEGCVEGDAIWQGDLLLVFDGQDGGETVIPKRRVITATR